MKKVLGIFVIISLSITMLISCGKVEEPKEIKDYRGIITILKTVIDNQSKGVFIKEYEEKKSNPEYGSYLQGLINDDSTYGEHAYFEKALGKSFQDISQYYPLTSKNLIERSLKDYYPKGLKLKWGDPGYAKIEIKASIDMTNGIIKEAESKIKEAGFEP